MNIFGAFGALGRLLPGYMQGERQAVQDNWQDLQNYNQVQQGQLANLMNEATFQPRVFDIFAQARQNALALQQSEQMQPGQLAAIRMRNPFMGMHGGMGMAAQIGLYNRMLQGMGAGGMGMGGGGDLLSRATQGDAQALSQLRAMGFNPFAPQAGGGASMPTAAQPGIGWGWGDMQDPYADFGY